MTVLVYTVKTTVHFDVSIIYTAALRVDVLLKLSHSPG